MKRQNSYELLKTTKNLLAFSGGVDSSALFFILMEAGIGFDIAIVDYNLRASSKDEVAYAEYLADKYGKKIYKHSVILGGSDFENSARKIRYDFFESVIKDGGYTALLTAHQLNDKLEWLLMRLTSGAGINTLVGMREVDSRGGYIIVRPILNSSRDEIVEFLKKNDIKYFEDESNLDEYYTRNAFRHKYSNALIKDFSNGIRRSFEILEQESDFLYDKSKIFWLDKLGVAKFDNDLQLLFFVDVMAKELGYLLSFEQKKEFLNTRSAVFGNKISVEVDGDLVYVAPHVVGKLTKQFKEEARVSGLPPKVRYYAASTSMSPTESMRLVRSFFTA